MESIVSVLLCDWSLCLGYHGNRSRTVIYGIWISFIIQVYPTVVRALGLGCCSAVARIGAMITPFVSQVWTLNFLL